MACRKFPFLIFSRIRTVTSGSGRATARTATMATNFVVYQNEVNNNATLTDNYIRGFAEDNRKNIWIATSNGINCIDYKTKKITRFYPKSINKECTTNIINRLLKHSDGNVYAFCNRSVFKCSMNQTVETVFPDIAIPSPTYSVAQAPDKDIYIGTESNGLYIYSENWKLKNTYPSTVSLQPYYRTTTGIYGWD